MAPNFKELCPIRSLIISCVPNRGRMQFAPTDELESRHGVAMQWRGCHSPAFSSAVLIILQGTLLSCLWQMEMAEMATAQTSQDFVYSRRINSDPNLLVQQGTALLRANHNEEAAVKFERLCAINPNSAKGHYQWGLALLKLGNRSIKAGDSHRSSACRCLVNPGRNLSVNR
jgi:tetratricopeptide (TPR) repeat protein